MERARQQDAPATPRADTVPAEHRLTLDQGVDLIDHAHGLHLSPEVLADICESGWEPCRVDGRGGWAVDAAGVSRENAARELMVRIARLASERQDAADVMDEPPAGDEAAQSVRRCGLDTPSTPPISSGARFG